MAEREILKTIAEDIYQLRLPLPFALNHVNVYLLRGAKGWTIVDTGIHWQTGEDGWKHAFETLNFSPKDIEKIVLTHAHPDHFGMSGYLQGMAKALGRDVPIFASENENAMAENVWWNEHNYDFGAWLQRNGMPPELAHQVDVAMDSTHSMTRPLPLPLQLIKAGESIQMGEREFLMIHAPGHSDGQLLFYDAADKILLSGDHVLMKITPNIGLWEHSIGNPLVMFMNSLQELRALNVRLALPGHRNLIEDWQGRIDELIGHHHERLALALETIEQGAKTPYEAALKIFETERFTPHEWRFAVAESHSHLLYLASEGKLLRSDSGFEYFMN